MTTNNLINNTKQYIAGIHQFITVGTGSTSVPISDIISQPDVNVMTIQNGNVGIGTVNPKSTLHVVGNILSTGNLTASNVSVIGDFVTMNTVTSNTEQMVITNDGTGPALKVTQTGDNSVAEFYDNESGIALFVGNNGNVGVGTTDPQTTLHVRPNTSTTGVIIDQVGTGSILDIKDGGISKVIVDTNGNVGIGTTNPQTSLHVNGNILCSDVIKTTVYYLSLHGIPTMYNSSKTLVSPPATTAQYIYLKWPNNNNFNYNPTTYYNNTYRLSIPKNGIYFIKLTVAGCSDDTLFITKNVDDNATTLNTGDDRLIAAGYPSGGQTTISGISYLTTTDYLVLGFYHGSSSTTPTGRTTAQIYCIQPL